MNMKVKHEIKATDLLSLMYCMSAEALKYHGYEEDETNQLTFDMFTEYLEYLGSKNDTLQLLID